MDKMGAVQKKGIQELTNWMMGSAARSLDGRYVETVACLSSAKKKRSLKWDDVDSFCQV